ncbi:MAG: tRNA(adenine34) deaminase [Candidatus Endobugula sp.]
MIEKNDCYWMQKALLLAQQAADINEIPVGAVVVKDNEIIGAGFNQPISLCDPTAHAEIQALRNAANHIGNYRLNGAVLYVTLEPCGMCAGAIVHSRIARLVYGATEPKAGVIVSQTQLLDKTYLNHKVLYQGGVCANECSAIISNFFSRRRAEKTAISNNL